MTEMSSMREAPEAIISKVRDIDEKLPKLLEGIGAILNQVSPLLANCCFSHFMGSVTSELN